MSFVRTLVLLLVAAGLGAYLWFVEAPKVAQEAKADLLLDFDPATIEKLRLAYPDGKEIALAKENGHWKMTAPVLYAADDTIVENLLRTIQETKIERRLAKGEAGQLSSYGLEGDRGSQARLEMTLAGGKALPAVVLGVTTPVGYQAFARREGSDNVLVIPLLLQSSARKEPDDIRLKQMFPGNDSSGVTKVTIEKGDQGATQIEVVRHGEADWTMTSPLTDSADTEAVRSMLDSMATIDAIAFYDGDKADRKAFGLDPGTRLHVQKENGSTIDFAIGDDAKDAPAGNYVERLSDRQVVKVGDWVRKKFLPEPNELRQRRLLSCRTEDIRRMTWTFGGDTFTIARGDFGKPWTILPEVSGQVLNQAVVDNAVQGLAAARADAVVGDATSASDLPPYGLDHPTATLDVQGAKGPCASLSAGLAPTTHLDGTVGDRRQSVKTYLLKDAARSAVMRASEHEYSRVAMKRPEFVDAAPAAVAPDNREAAVK